MKRSGIQPLDELAIQMLSLNGWTEDSVPEKGQFVALRRIETTAWGALMKTSPLLCIQITLKPQSMRQNYSVYT